MLCIRLSDGEVVWEKNFRDEYPLEEELPWGYCGSPLLVDGLLVVMPGASDASIIALDPRTGQTKWKASGKAASYGSLIEARFGGQRQILGHDATTLGGWDIKTGKRLWTITPENDGDFNVPTPLLIDGDLVVVTENNGLRRYQADSPDGIRLLASNHRLRSDMSSPVAVGGNVYCVKDFLYCFDAKTLKEKWRLRDKAIGDYGAVIASSDRILVVANGELLMLASNGSKSIISRQKVFDQRVEMYSHPAIVGKTMYIRGEQKLIALGL